MPDTEAVYTVTAAILLSLAKRLGLGQSIRQCKDYMSFVVLYVHRILKA